MKSIDMTNVQEAGEFTRPTPGAYICGIYKAEDVSDKESPMTSLTVSSRDTMRRCARTIPTGDGQGHM